MTKTLHIGLARINPTIGDVAGNMEKVVAARRAAAEAGADLLVCPELVVSGYPPEDLVLRPAFARACHQAVEDFVRSTDDGGPGVVLTTPWHKKVRRDDPRPITLGPHAEPRPFNALMLIDRGESVHRQFKMKLPNYGVFDEPRTFRPGDGRDLAPVDFRGVRLGFLICEDMWYKEPASRLAQQGVDLLIAPHGSPFRLDAAELRRTQAGQRAKETERPVLFINQIGGQDELVFDGDSFIVDAAGNIQSAEQFDDDLIITTWQQGDSGWSCEKGPMANLPDANEAAYLAAVMGTRDYVTKSGFSKVVIGLSGGIDSALVAAMAVDALGADNVHCVMMPSQFTSAHSLEDAKACAGALGVRYDIIGIDPVTSVLEGALGACFDGRPRDVAEENIQSRTRGVILMALSNKLGSMLLTTGNKSEMAVGYATLYGDMNGGFNPLKDIYKTEVYELAHWRNTNRPSLLKGPSARVIPERIISKEPSAELREDQTDQDSLPPYEVLDAILRGLIEEEDSVDAIAEQGFDRATVAHVQRLLYGAEYKRNQAPPGPKIQKRNFGRDRRYPIVNRWRE
ncbi:MAG: NAD+ synthase [Parvularcula sp.]